MKIGFVSFKTDRDSFAEERLDQIIRIFQKCKGVDLLLFPGYTIPFNPYKKEEFIKAKKMKQNLDRECKKYDFAIFYEFRGGTPDTKKKGQETEAYKKERGEGYYIYIPKHKSVNKEGIIQEFAKNPVVSKVAGFIDKLEKERVFTVKKRKVLLLICGEIYILKHAEFCCQNKELKARFEKIISNEDMIILNPAHTYPVGRWYIYYEKFAKLSKHGRVCVFTINNTPSIDFHKTSLGFVYHNGKRIPNSKYKEDYDKEGKWKLSIVNI